MKIGLFYHSLVSDWNHGNAHFLRGIASELQSRGHEVKIFEPANGWSRMNLLQEHGEVPLKRFQAAFPGLSSETYRLSEFDADRMLDGFDLILVHEWSEPELIAKVGQYRKRASNLRLLFHDTHHRAVSAPEELARFDLRYYDGVLAYGASLQRAYQRLGWAEQVHVWHEAADTRIFYPHTASEKKGDVVWIGNWGDDERTEELREFLLRPVAEEQFRAQVYGVRYPAEALDELARCGIAFGGWLANFEVPGMFAQYRATVHVPRRPYIRQLPGIPTIRVFEALACGIPLVSAPWPDEEQLFRAGKDFLTAKNGVEMRKQLRAIIEDRDLAETLARNGRETIEARHTCRHRVDELLAYVGRVKPALEPQEAFS